MGIVDGVGGVWGGGRRRKGEGEGEAEEEAVGVSGDLCGLFAFDHSPDCVLQGACK